MRSSNLFESVPTIIIKKAGCTILPGMEIFEDEAGEKSDLYRLVNNEKFRSPLWSSQTVL
jgi:hypothetical protein